MAAPALELAVAASLASTPVVTMPTASAAPQLQWMSQDDWQTVVTRRELVAELKAERKAQCHQVTLPKAERKSSWQSSNHAGDCVKRLHTDVRAAAAGFQDDWSAKAVRRAELKQEDPERAQMDKAAEARRKRVRRIEDGKEDRDAMRTLSCSLNEEMPLESTPAGLREAATDGTPRSARAAGMKLRQLTQTFHQRLLDPRLYGATNEQLETLRVPTVFWTAEAECARQRWVQGSRPLKVFQGTPTMDVSAGISFYW